MSRNGGGRGVRRRRRKKGLTRQHNRFYMTVGIHACYKVVYDLKPGDVFRFINRHTAVDHHREVLNCRERQAAGRPYKYTLTEYLDFPKGSPAIWLGWCWLTTQGYFLPRSFWWGSFPATLDPVSIEKPKRVVLKILAEPPKKTCTHAKAVSPPPRTFLEELKQKATRIFRGKMT